MQRIILWLAGPCVLVTSLLAFAQTKPLPETEQSTIGYQTVAEALAALHNDPNVKFTTNHGWTIAINEKARAVWAFAPKDDPSYPSAVKRTVVPALGGGSNIVMDVECDASKQACDSMVRKFLALYRPAYLYSSPQFSGSSH